MRLPRLTIRARLLLVIGLAIISAGTIRAIVEISGIESRVVQELNSKIDIVTRQGAKSLTTALWELNRDQALQILDGLALNPDFRTAVVTDQVGDVFVRLENGKFRPGLDISATANIVLDSSTGKRTIGALTIVLSRDRATIEQRAVVLNSIIGAAVNIVAVFIAALVGVYLITGPMEAIAAAMLRVAKGETDRATPYRTRRDQIGALAQAVEAFRSEIGRRKGVEDELRIAHSQLEARIIERTAELRRSEQSLRVVLDNTREAVISIDANGTIMQVNRIAETMFGYRDDEMLGQNIKMLMPESYKLAHDRQMKAYRETGVAKVVGIDREVEGKRKDGSIFPLGLFISRVKVDDQDGYVGTIRDLSETKQIQDQLRQAQKMEAVGQLTGGIAHDFNNLLTVILGNAEILTEELVGHPSLKRMAEMVGMAAQRGADLTASLLALSRKQTLAPKITDINQLVMRMDGLLRRTLGEHVEIAFAPVSGLWSATVDPAQLEAAILNLAVNARDAMPNGGKLAIETANVEFDEGYSQHNEGVSPGPYVMITVTDTGTGMTPEVQTKAFDPFFTTKEVGKGSGLGLSMVYGFVKQSNGYIKLYSEVGHGTTVKLYLPRSAATDEPSAAQDRPAETRGGSEVILMVEDDTMVRTYVESQLAGLGYRVLVASNGQEALDILRKNQLVDLLFTDVVMPGGMGGPQLAKAALGLRPALRILYTSGYTGSAMTGLGTPGGKTDLLSKPYGRHELAAKLRKVLEA